MRAGDVIASAVHNTFRSKLRTSLTVIAIFIGAFTLTITSAIGAGITNFIDSQVGAIGAPGVLAVSPAPDTDAAAEGPPVYDPDRATGGASVDGPPGSTIVGLNQDDLDAIAEIDGITGVTPMVSLAVDFIEAGGSEQYELPLDLASGAFVPDLAAGAAVADVTERQLQIPADYVEPLGFADAQAAIGQSVTLGVTDGVGGHHEVGAVVVGVSNQGLLNLGAEANEALADALIEAQRTGAVGEATPVYLATNAYIDPASTPEQIDAIKAALLDAGFQGSTTADQIGAFKTVIDVVTTVLNAFAVIALLAAGFGIVNTLLMSVQERTREIGLMKAMGMRSGKVFGLFSMEAVFIGFLGSALGAGVAILLGLIAAPLLAESLLAGLPGLEIVRFEPLSVAVIVLAVMAIAFLAGTLPARRAARQHPIEALRYE
ncbi:ABC transporter permease [Agrococcus sp. ARC_14]|uniref:ABC transporter permease n=1 Tax=Agrococcus sp. ARC_14 TaxID=2919927 RepID=UPI001F06A820|nr:ABC transporter permease [Agrococcus sp. ARC_14]MCH1881836.1 ABC transporter permease [Agrococcus sp. ARC_14]